MKDIEVIKRICNDYNIELNQTDSYSWDEVGYVLNSEGRVEVFNLHSKLIKKIPGYINELSELKILHLVGNELESILEIGGLKKMEILALQANRIASISIIEQFQFLKELYISHNPIANLKPLGNLGNLEKLSIGNREEIIGCDYTPIGSLANLQELYLGHRELQNPSFLLSCKKLEKLHCWGNGFFEGDVLSEQFYKCIEKLNLKELGISAFAKIDLKKIVDLSQLRSLVITNCQLGDIHLISKMTQLQDLDLSYNTIVNIKSLSKLIRLQNINLANNRIIDISPLENLRFLKSINLRANYITDLKPLLSFGMNFVYDMSDYEKGEKEQLTAHECEILISRCNNITNPPIEIVKQGNEAIQRYFRKIKEEGFDYIYEAKLILVGEGSSGKTSLKRRLIDETALLPESDKRTRGIEVIDFIFHKEKNTNQIAHIWDFGGQDVYYPVHRFFITENSVFVLLASTRQTSHNFDYWIPTIFQFGGESPIIIGQTCHEGNTAPWNDVDIYLSNSNFNIIKTLEKPYYRIDLPNNNLGLPVIKECVIDQLRNLHHFGKGVPKSWLTIRNELNTLSTSKSCIPFQQLIDLCRKLEPDSFQYIQDIEDCCHFFHDIGVILWYSQIEELREWVVLQPEWAMNAVYKIIDDNDIQDRNGLILQDDFKRLWSESTYEGKHNFLKKMLETFKIAFPKRHNQGEYIIPARLTSMPKEKKWGLEEKCLRLEYKFEFMPRGIVNQITSELSRYIFCNEVWNNAVTLAYENNYSRCQIMEDSYNRNLSIVSKGIDARGMNMLVMNSIRNIVESYKGVKEEIYVNCTCPVCQKLEAPTTFLYSKLVEWSNKREGGTVTCNESGESLVIADLLYNAGFEKVSRKAELLPKNKTISVFLASSEELKNDREAFEIFINRENKELNKSGIFLNLEIWEDFIDKMSKTRLQDEYNKAAIKSDIFISLFWTKAGLYTREEFKVSYDHYKNNGKPFIYTYFKDEPIAPSRMNDRNVGSLLNFRDELKQLGHYPTVYKNIDDLKYQFKTQLQKVLPELI